MARQFTREQRYWFNLEKRGDDECWGWRGSRGTGGYARLGADYAHRWAYEHFVGPIPDGMEIDHLCGNRSCTNWRHLEAVTHAENMRRGGNAAKTHCKRGHPLLGHNLIEERGRRRCRTCGLIRDKAYRARRANNDVKKQAT